MNYVLKQTRPQFFMVLVAMMLLLIAVTNYFIEISLGFGKVGLWFFWGGLAFLMFRHNRTKRFARERRLVKSEDIAEATSEQIAELVKDKDPEIYGNSLRISKDVVSKKAVSFTVSKNHYFLFYLYFVEGKEVVRTIEVTYQKGVRHQENKEIFYGSINKAIEHFVEKGSKKPKNGELNKVTLIEPILPTDDNTEIKPVPVQEKPSNGVKGRVVAFGSKRFFPKQEGKKPYLSPYISIEKNDGYIQTLQGVELPEAIEASGLKKGSLITISKSREWVKVIDDESGKEQSVLKNLFAIKLIKG